MTTKKIIDLGFCRGSAIQKVAENMSARLRAAGFPGTIPEMLKATKGAGLKIYTCKAGAALLANVKEADLLPEIELVEPPDKLVNDIVLAADKILRV